MNILAQAILGFEVPVRTLFALGPAVGVSLFAFPSYISVLRQKPLKGLFILIILGLFAIGFETLAVKTGLPYGRFSYDTVLGYKLFGSTPWTVALAYPPILLAAFWVASKVSTGFVRIILTALAAVVLDLVLDPAAVKLEFWKWDQPGPYFGVPLINFAGWLVSGLIGALLLQLLWGKHSVRRGAAYSGLCILVFWTGVNAGVSQWIPFALGSVLSIALLILIRGEKKSEKQAS